MKTRILNQNETVNEKIKQNLKDLNKAELAAWALFIGVGVLYVVLSLVIAK